uniref:Uncharacterized protein n=1 Tax=Octopus bimaculoides TaxID=37653 RepID=A0A0L8FGS3_OCTBM
MPVVEQPLINSQTKDVVEHKYTILVSELL